jgi:hypothetical protein
MLSNKYIKNKTIKIWGATQGILEPSTSEAFEAFHATRLITYLGLQNIILEGDTKQIVGAINSLMSLWSHYGHLVDDTRRLLCSLSR